MKDRTQDDAQRQKFIETARALGGDEDEAAFKAKLAVIGRQKPKEGTGDAKGGSPGSSDRRK